MRRATSPLKRGLVYSEHAHLMDVREERWVGLRFAAPEWPALFKQAVAWSKFFHASRRSVLNGLNALTCPAHGVALGDASSHCVRQHPSLEAKGMRICLSLLSRMPKVKHRCLLQHVRHMLQHVGTHAAACRYTCTYLHVRANTGTQEPDSLVLHVHVGMYM